MGEQRLVVCQTRALRLPLPQPNSTDHGARMLSYVLANHRRPNPAEDLSTCRLAYPLFPINRSALGFPTTFEGDPPRQASCERGCSGTCCPALASMRRTTAHGRGDRKEAGRQVPRLLIRTARGGVLLVKGDTTGRVSSFRRR